MRVSNLKKEKSHPNLVNAVFIVWRSNENDLVVLEYIVHSHTSTNLYRIYGTKYIPCS